MLSEAREASGVEAPTALRLRPFGPPLSVTKNSKRDKELCAFGVIAGQHRIALQGEAPNGLLWYLRDFQSDGTRYVADGWESVHPTWSVDYGKTWHDGEPVTFDGNDILLYKEEFDDIVRSEQGQIVFMDPSIIGIRWSR
jgi:hypothetical protein